jgi:hypothetical protein
MEATGAAQGIGLGSAQLLEIYRYMLMARKI